MSDKAFERQGYSLTPAELQELKLLRFPEDIWPFWFAVGERLGIDYKSIIVTSSDRKHFSALPKGHNHYWCYPIPLVCKPFVWEEHNSHHRGDRYRN
jgi:hypothetical protein